MSARPHPLWDLPTRLCHWLLVLLFPLAWWTAESSLYRWHERIGIALLSLVLFRLVWGFVGSPASRFRHFLRGPKAVFAYVRGRGQTPRGHNPLGGWYVLMVLLLLMVQAVSGLFNSDDILVDGPLHHLASSAWQDRFGVLHELAFDALLVLVALHLLAVGYHQWLRREALVQAMVRGHAPGKEGESSPAPLWLAVVLAGLAALLLYGGLALVPPPVSPW